MLGVERWALSVPCCSLSDFMCAKGKPAEDRRPQARFGSGGAGRPRPVGIGTSVRSQVRPVAGQGRRWLFPVLLCASLLLTAAAHAADAPNPAPAASAPADNTKAPDQQVAVARAYAKEHKVDFVAACKALGFAA